MLMFGSAGNGSISEDGLKLIGQEGELILEIDRRLEDHNEGIWSEIRIHQRMVDVEGLTIDVLALLAANPLGTY
jgi:hypothetical protein